MIWIVAAAFIALGGLRLEAGRAGEAARPGHEGRPGRVSALVDNGLQRTRHAVDVLIQPDVHPDEVRPTESAMRNRAQSYQGLGGGLVAIAVLMTLGVLLLVGG